ncbi:MAG: cell wall hydrolase [Devosia nanyangense]|uniref:Cell wall hydrolase n=1 Tax=Devosia nanyangense TaxID=1228055 RepID=A0A933L4L1_9HYPH|nr:cell wall hydrolase [Devosia nanyangense]
MGRSGPTTAWARPGHSLAGVLASLVLSVLAWPLLVGAAHGPGTEAPLVMPQPAAIGATLTRHGDDLIITGSVAALFSSGSFSGPNRAEKTNRARLTPDGITVSSDFEGIRTRLAELRAPDSSVPMPPVLVPTVKVASIDPAQSAALGAIDQIVPMAAAPMPMSAPTQLAYARETTPATSFDLSVDKFGGKVSQKDLWCMATAVYFEARGETYRGQVAVGQVVMNRLAHRIYPKTICGVVFQNQHMRNACQFSFACDGIPETVTESKAWAQAEEIAKGVINGSLYLTDVEKATHYHATYVYPDWAPRLKKVVKIGHHVFYKFKRA